MKFNYTILCIVFSLFFVCWARGEDEKEKRVETRFVLFLMNSSNGKHSTTHLRNKTWKHDLEGLYYHSGKKWISISADVGKRTNQEFHYKGKDELLFYKKTITEEGPSYLPVTRCILKKDITRYMIMLMGTPVNYDLKAYPIAIADDVLKRGNAMVYNYSDGPIGMMFNNLDTKQLIPAKEYKMFSLSAESSHIFTLMAASYHDGAWERIFRRRLPLHKESAYLMIIFKGERKKFNFIHFDFNE